MRQRRRQQLDDEDLYGYSPDQTRPRRARGSAASEATTAAASRRSTAKKTSESLSIVAILFLVLTFLAFLISIIVLLLSVVPNAGSDLTSPLTGAAPNTPRPWFYTELQWHQESNVIKTDLHLWVDDSLEQYAVTAAAAGADLNTNATDDGLVVKPWATNADLRMRAYAQRGMSALALLSCFVGMIFIILVGFKKQSQWGLTISAGIGTLCNAISWGISHHFFTSFLWSGQSYCELVAPPALLFAHRCTETVGTGYYLNFAALWMLAIATLSSSIANLVAMPSIALYIKQRLEKMRRDRRMARSVVGNGETEALHSSNPPPGQQQASREIARMSHHQPTDGDVEMESRGAVNYHSRGNIGGSGVGGSTYPPQQQQRLQHHPIRSPERNAVADGGGYQDRSVSSQQPHQQQQQQPFRQQRSFTEQSRPYAHTYNQQQQQVSSSKTVDLDLRDDFEEVQSMGGDSDFSAQPPVGGGGEVNNTGGEDIVLDPFQNTPEVRRVDPTIKDWERVHDDNVEEMWFSPSRELYLDNKGNRMYDAKSGQWHPVEEDD